MSQRFPKTATADMALCEGTTEDGIRCQLEPHWPSVWHRATFGDAENISHDTPWEIIEWEDPSRTSVKGVSIKW